MSSTDDDPVIASYDVLLTDSDISRYVFQYLDRPQKLPYNERRGQKPTSLRMKSGTGMVEVEVPIQTRGNYDVTKGLKYGDAMKKSRAGRDGGAFGMAGGFSSGSMASGGGRVKAEGGGDVEVLDNKKVVDPSSLVRTQALGGRIKPQEEGDPVYMLATFKGSKCALFKLFCHSCANSCAQKTCTSHLFLRLSNYTPNFTISMHWMKCPRVGAPKARKMTRSAQPRPKRVQLM